MFIPWYILRSSMVVAVDDTCACAGGMCGPISLRFVLSESKVLLLVTTSLLVHEFCEESELYDAIEGTMFTLEGEASGEDAGS